MEANQERSAATAAPYRARLKDRAAAAAGGGHRPDVFALGWNGAAGAGAARHGAHARSAALPTMALEQRGQSGA